MLIDHMIPKMDNFSIPSDTIDRDEYFWKIRNLEHASV